MRDTLIWYTVDNKAGDSWCDFLDTFVDAEGDFDKYDDAGEAIEKAENLWTLGERCHTVTEHIVRRDGVERTYTYWEK